MKRKIIVLQGLPASGKSTWAKTWVKEDPKHRVRFNRDDIRNMLGEYWVPTREHLINSIYDAFLEESMEFDYNIVLDNMNLNKKTLREIERIVEDRNRWNKEVDRDIQYEIEYKTFFDTSLETCIERDSKRENPVGEKAIRDIYNKYKDSYPL